MTPDAPAPPPAEEVERLLTVFDSAIAEAVTESLRDAGERVRAARARRDQLIREAHAAGESIDAIARQVGLTEERVGTIIERG